MRERDYVTNRQRHYVIIFVCFNPTSCSMNRHNANEQSQVAETLEIGDEDSGQARLRAYSFYLPSTP